MKNLFLLSLVVMTLSSPKAEAFRILSSEVIKKNIGPFPAHGSEEEIRDFEVIRHYQETRTEADCKLAGHEESANVITMFAGKGGPLTLREARRMHVRFIKTYIETGLTIRKAKRIYRRERPYVRSAEVVPCIDLEGSFAYPSGHTTLARVLALKLSRIYPDRAEAFMKRADQSALNRIIGGVHHPSDIEAGKKLADLIVKGIPLN